MFDPKVHCRKVLILLPLTISIGWNSALALPQQSEGDWRFLDPYAVALMEDAHGTDYVALERTESAANKDSNSLAKAYVHLARALQARMRFRLNDADREAVECIKAAQATQNDTAQALCGWLRLNLARIRNDFAAMATISNDMSAVNRKLLSRAGLTQEDAVKSTSFFSLAGAAGYQDMASWPKSSVTKSKDEPSIVKLDTSHDDYLLVNGEINGQPIQFDLDTGSGYSIISPELASRLNITMAKYKEYKGDLRGNPTPYGMGLIPALTVGTVTVHNLPVYVGSISYDNPILGMDFLFQIGTFGISDNSLILGESPIHTCNTPAVLRSSIAPDSPLVGVAIHTNFGEFYASLDTGSSGIGYAWGDWKMRKKLGVGSEYILKPQILKSLSGQSVVGFTDVRMQIFLDGDVFDRELRLYPDPPLNTDIVMNRAAIKDFSFFYDLPRGMACLRVSSDP
jgi:predicted aspartyl protease